jgi:hypothetical protein
MLSPAAKSGTIDLLHAAILATRINFLSSIDRLI